MIKSGLCLLTKAVIFLARSVVIFDLVNEISLSLFGVVSSEFVAELLSAIGVVVNLILVFPASLTINLTVNSVAN